MGISHHSRAGTSAEVQVFFNAIHFGMTPLEAVTAPRIHSEYKRRTVWVDTDFPEDALRDFEALGTQKIIVSSHLSPAVSFGLRNRVTGELEGAADPRGDGGLAIVQA